MRLAEARGLLKGDSLSPVQLLGLEYLMFADGLLKREREDEQDRNHRELLDTLVKGALVASGDYQEKVLFPEYFPDEDGLPYGESRGDADTDLDYSAVDFGVPDESEMEILQRMLADDSVSVDGTLLEGPDAVQPSGPDEGAPELVLPPPREFDAAEIEQDTEWT